MSATSEANSKSAFFAIGKQSAKGTAATALFKAIATVSELAPEMEYKDNRIEHPSSVPDTSWLLATPQQPTGYLAGAAVTFALRPKFIVPVLMAAGYKVTSVDGTGYYTHTLVQDTDVNHKWFTIAWSVPESDGTFVTRGVDMRCTSFSLDVSPEEIMVTAEFRGLTVEPMSGSPTYTDEVDNEIVPWLGTRTTLTIGGYTTVERIRSITIDGTNELREDDKAIWEPTRTSLGRTSFGLDIGVSDMNISDDVYEALAYGATAGTTVTTAAVTGAVDIQWVSAAVVPTTIVPYKFQTAMPSVQWKLDGRPQANGDDLMTIAATGSVIANVSVPNTITVVNEVASY